MSNTKIDDLELIVNRAIHWLRHRDRACRTFQWGGPWGNHVSLGPREKWPGENGAMRVYGHHPFRPRDGDLLEVPMRSGKTRVGYFERVELCSDPPDMWFGTVRWTEVEAR